MATVETVINTRQIRDVMWAYQPLRDIWGFTLDPPLRPSHPWDTKTDLTLGVGRLHYSLSSTLSAHFR